MARPHPDSVSMVRLRFAARDPGGANVLASFLAEWAGKHHVQVDAWTCPKATAAFSDLGVQTREFTKVSRDDIDDAWRQTPAHALVTATSHYAPFEPTLWRIAASHRCPSLAVIDQWTNLPARFAAGVPDAIGAIDLAQRNALLELGITAAQTLVVGQPVLSRLARRGTRFMDSKCANQGRVRNVLFVSEPIASDVREGSNRCPGFDESTCFALLHRAASVAARSGNVKIAVRFHPYEDPRSFIERAKALPETPNLTLEYTSQDQDAQKWLDWADLVVGISSMLLLEAAVMGKPVVSVQPKTELEDTFILSRLGFVEAIADTPHGNRQIVRLLEDRNLRAQVISQIEPFVTAIRRDSHTSIAAWIDKAVRDRDSRRGSSL